MKKRVLSMLLSLVMLMSFFVTLTASAAETSVSVVFYDVMTKKAITDLEGVGSIYAKVSFTSPQKANAFIICSTYDADDKLLETHICETVSTASEYTTENIDLTGARTIRLFVMESRESLVPLCASSVLTRTTDDGTVSLAFDDKSLVTIGAYDPEAMVEGAVQGAYDNTVKSVTSGITKTQYVNNNMPIDGTTKEYVNRNSIYTTIDLSDKLPAKKVTVNFTGSVGASAESKMYISQVDGYPTAGEELDAGTRLAEATMNGNTTGVAYTCDITEAYNKAVGSALYLRIYGWYGNSNFTGRTTGAVSVSAASLSLSVTPSTGNDFKVTFNEGAEEIPAGVYEEITLPQCANVIAGRKFAGWSDGKNVYQAGEKYIVNSSVEFEATYEKDPSTYTAAQKALDGKKVMFIGNSYVYYGNCVIQLDQTKYQWNQRNNDKGYFYQLCKENNIDVTVRNWCFSGHDLNQTFQGPCSSSYAECKGVDHESHLEDKYLDYVIISLHASDAEENNLEDNIDYVMNFFREANSNVKFVLLGNHAVHGVTNRSDSYHPGIIEYYKTLEEKGFIIADWGEIISDIVGGTTAVPGATQQYNRNTFVNTNDGHHENELAGYITALSAFCAITDESAVGQPYEFCFDASLHKHFDLYGEDRGINRYTKATDTNFIEVFESPSDMLGLQKLVDRYINPELIVPVTLTLNGCDDAGTTTHEKGEEVTLPTPVKSSLSGKYIFKNWTDGTKTYAAGDKIVLNANVILTAQWDYESGGVSEYTITDLSLLTAGKWDATAEVYDNLVKSIKTSVTGKQDLNMNKPINKSGVYFDRAFLYACVDLTNEVAAQNVILNFSGEYAGTSKVYIYNVSGIPAVGEEIVTGKQIAAVSLSKDLSNTVQSVDITQAYNEAVGSKLYLRILGWYNNEKKYTNAVKVDASSLSLSVTPYLEGKYAVTFNEGAEPIYAEKNAEITLPEYSMKIPGQKFTGWSDGTTTYQPGATYKVTKTTSFTAVIVDDPDSMTEAQKLLDGKKVIFVGNSHIFYGRTVNASYSNELSRRTNDTGGFYQLCKQNGIDVSVTNWTFSGHGLSSIFGGEPCYTHENCGGVVHLDKLTDNNYDYVVITPGVASNYTSLPDHIETIHNFFKAGNPNVKVIILGNASVHGINADSKSYPDTPAQYKDLYNKGYSIADWGYLVKNIINGTETVSGATQVYNKNTFIVKDGYHPNMLSGYIATLFTYCTITGEKAEGQPYMYFWNSSTTPQDVAEYVKTYYKNGDADTTFPEILKSESDIRGIQKLVDEYIAEKAYLDKY